MNCPKCSQPMRPVQSARLVGALPGVRYTMCDACGYVRPIRKAPSLKDPSPFPACPPFPDATQCDIEVLRAKVQARRDQEQK